MRREEAGRDRRETERANTILKAIDKLLLRLGDQLLLKVSDRVSVR